MDFSGVFSIYNFVIFFIIAIVAFVWYMSKNNGGHWKAMGIKGPTPTLVFGNFIQVSRKGFRKAQLEWYKEYDRIYTTCFGRTTSLTIGEPDMVKEILVKQFNNFAMRQVRLGATMKPFDRSLTVVDVEDWKRIRTIISPAFSTGKLKQMVPLIVTATDRFVENMTRKSESGEDIEIYDASGQYALDVIASVAFGIQIDSQQNPKDPFVVNAKSVVDFSFWKLFIFFMFPSIARVLARVGISVFKEKPMQFFTNIVDQVITERKEAPKVHKHKDFIQLMLDENDLAVKEGADSQDSTEDNSSKKGLSQDEMYAQAIIFFLGGHDTTGSALSMAFYCMALYPEATNKVIEELDSVVGENEPLTYDNVAKLVYMEQFLLESQRVFPVAPRTDRTCTHATEVNGISIEKGQIVTVPILGIHLDPEFYPDPHRFDPDRFTLQKRAERNPFHYLPFGHGPRQCIAMRLAILEMKFCLAATLRKFRPVKVSRTQDNPDFNKLGRLHVIGGAWIGMERRIKT